MPDRAESGAASQPEWAGPRLIACGVVLLVTISATAAIDPTRDVGVFLGLTAVASLAYLISLGLVAWGGHATNRVLVLCLLLAAAWRIPLLLGPPLLSTDIYRYVWDGRVQRLGHNPYVSAPADPALQHLHTPLTARTEHADLPTIYPPFAELVFRGIASIQESVLPSSSRNSCVKSPSSCCSCGGSGWRDETRGGFSRTPGTRWPRSRRRVAGT